MHRLRFTYRLCTVCSAIERSQEAPSGEAEIMPTSNHIQGTLAEYEATVQGSISYFGTYSVSGTDLVPHVEGSTFPNWNGTDQKRNNLSVTGDELKFTNPAPSGGGGAADAADPLVWKRAK
jgi:lipocalin-like protein